ncbi:MAG: GNAT family N-acetyltransferase [Prevotella sp.]
MYTNISLRQGKMEDAPQIARMIVMAMTDECCRHFYGDNHSADDFLRLITRLASSRNTQYSYENTICATDGNNPDSRIVGISVSYDGARLLELRKAFLDGALSAFGIDHSGMSAETSAGELYLDSLAVLPEYRGKGIATMLLNATAEKARRLGCGPLGLLVDEGNPRAERLYTAVGFKHVGNNDWGGHAMKHLQLPVS